jgi:hypothetical protein
MGVTNICLVRIPAMGRLEIITVDIIDLVHLDLANRIEVHSIDVDTAIPHPELRIGVDISHNQ